MPTSRTISIKYGQMNSPPVSKRIKSGTTLGDFAESLSCPVSKLFVNSSKQRATYRLRAGDVVVQITNVSGGC
jgi:hypothetical protein